MNLQRVSVEPKGYRLFCPHCNQWRPTHMVRADLDGEPFKAYICDLCSVEQGLPAPPDGITFA